MKPSINTAIRYCPRDRCLRLALAYLRFPSARDQLSHDLYGFMVGYSGGGSYEEDYFHVGLRQGEGYVSFTSGWPGQGWREDRIGFSDLANTDFADGVERILESVSAYLFRRWIKNTEGDFRVPDLRNGAKRRLNSKGRRGFYLSPGFDEELLVFMSPQWVVTWHYGPDW